MTLPRGHNSPPYSISSLRYFCRLILRLLVPGFELFSGQPTRFGESQELLFCCKKFYAAAAFAFVIDPDGAKTGAEANFGKKGAGFFNSGKHFTPPFPAMNFHRPARVN